MTAEIPFPVYHGTSSYYAHWFRSGVPVNNWPYKARVMSFVEKAAKSLKRLNMELEFYEDRVLNQADHWEHGYVYVSPSRSTAAKYAWSNAAYGGELINVGVEMLHRIRKFDRKEADALLAEHQESIPMLSGLGSPLVLEIRHISLTSVAPERRAQSSEINILMDYHKNESLEFFETISQQSNFRLLPGAGAITRVFKVLSADGGDSFEYHPANWDEF